MIDVVFVVIPNYPDDGGYDLNCITTQSFSGVNAYNRAHRYADMMNENLNMSVCSYEVLSIPEGS